LVIDRNGNEDKQTFEIIISEDGGNNFKILDIQGGFGIKTTILAGNEPINWTINLDGEFIFLDGSSSGTIDPNGIQTVKTSLFT